MMIDTRDAAAGRIKPGQHIHLVGIGGAGISAIAQVLLGRGCTVSGSDLLPNALTDSLHEAGARIFTGHDAANISGADMVVVSSAVPVTNPEIVAARAVGIPVLKRADFLGLLMADRVGIAVAGSHGKTTTTGMIAHIYVTLGKDPSVIVGGVLPLIGSNGRAGRGQHLIIEADEYDYMFHGLRPQTAVIVNLEHDHPDIFRTMAVYRAAFRDFAALLPDDGTLLACSDDSEARQLLVDETRPTIRRVAYGLKHDMLPAGIENVTASNLRQNHVGGLDFVVQRNGETAGLARLRVPGEHNVQNGLGALAVAMADGIPFGDAAAALAEFGGMGRRFQVKGTVNDVIIIDDYAHHPTEIEATLRAARQRYRGRRLWAIWQPHTFSRTKLLYDAFAESFSAADRVVVLDVYRSREQETLGVDVGELVNRMHHPHARFLGAREAGAAYVLDRVMPGDVVLTLGAGDGDAVGDWILDGLLDRAG